MVRPSVPDQMGKVPEIVRPGPGAEVEENVQPERGGAGPARAEFPWANLVIKRKEYIFGWRKLRTQVEVGVKLGAGSPVSDPGRSRPGGRVKT